MALTQPILYDVDAFDASREAVFYFNVIGGDQIDRNILTIKRNDTLETVYNGIETNLRFSHTLPAHTLENGVYYIATITTIGIDGVNSIPSQPVPFWCYTAPSFVFTNIESGVVDNSSYEFNVLYKQIEGEKLSQYVFNLYDDSDVLIASSGNKYNTESSPTNIKFLFSGFANNTKYTIECNGITVENTQITTGKIDFIVNYKSTSITPNFSLSNNCKRGYITVQCAITSIDGTYEKYLDPGATPVYINSEEIDLSEDTMSLVYWKDGFGIEGDFTMSLWGRGFATYGNIIYFSGSDGAIFVKYHEGKYKDETNDSVWASLVIEPYETPYASYIITSNNLTQIPTDDTTVSIYIRRVGEWYDISISTTS